MAQKCNYVDYRLRVSKVDIFSYPCIHWKLTASRSYDTDSMGYDKLDGVFRNLLILSVSYAHSSK